MCSRRVSSSFPLPANFLYMCVSGMDLASAYTIFLFVIKTEGVISLAFAFHFILLARHSYLGKADNATLVRDTIKLHIQFSKIAVIV